MTTGLPQLNAYQLSALKRLTDAGWTFVCIRRLQNELNPWASINMRSPNGQYMLTAFPVSKVEQEAMSA